jgi:hypothetical protein
MEKREYWDSIVPPTYEEDEDCQPKANAIRDAWRAGLRRVICSRPSLHGSGPMRDISERRPRIAL